MPSQRIKSQPQSLEETPPNRSLAGGQQAAASRRAQRKRIDAIGRNIQHPAQNSAISGTTLAVKEKGLKAEFFFFAVSLAAMPSLKGLAPDQTKLRPRPISGIPTASSARTHSAWGWQQNFAARYFLVNNNFSATEFFPT